MKATDDRCFYLAYPSDGAVFSAEDGWYVGSEIRCFGSREDALAHAHQGVDDEHGIPMVQQRPAPCVTLACAGCDYVYDVDNSESGGPSHFADAAEVRAFVAEAGWVVLHGDPLCERCKPSGSPVDGGPAEAGVGQAPLFEEAP